MQIKIKQKIYSCRWTAILATCALACQSVVAPNYKKFDSCQGLYTSRVFFLQFPKLHSTYRDHFFASKTIS